MRARVAAGELAGPFLRDAEQAAAQAYGATATPEVFVIDREGIVRYHGAPDGDHDDPAAERPLAARRAGRRAGRPRRSAGPRPRRPAARSSGGSSCSGGTAARPTSGPPNCSRDTLAELGRGDVHVVERQVRTREEAERLGFPGLADLPGGPARPVPDRAAPALTCRVYAPPTAAAPRCPTPPTSPRACARRSPARGICPAGWTPASPRSAGVLMASITYERIVKRYPDGTQAVS